MPGLTEAPGLFARRTKVFRIDAHVRFFDINISPVFKFYFMIMPEKLCSFFLKSEWSCPGGEYAGWRKPQNGVSIPPGICGDFCILKKFLLFSCGVLGSYPGLH